MSAATSRSNAARGPVEVVGVERRDASRGPDRRAARRAGPCPSRAAGTAPSSSPEAPRSTIPCPSAGGNCRSASATVCSGESTTGVSQATGCCFTQRIAVAELLQRQVLRQHAEPAPARERGREPRPGHRVHVGRDDRDGGSAAVARGEIHVEPAGDGRPAGHQEHVRVGQIVGGDGAEKAHESTLGPRTTVFPGVPHSGDGARAGE